MSAPDFTVEEAANRHGVPDTSLRRWLRNGDLPGMRVHGERGPEWRINPDDLAVFLWSRGYLRGADE